MFRSVFLPQMITLVLIMIVAGAVEGSWGLIVAGLFGAALLAGEAVYHERRLQAEERQMREERRARWHES